MPIYAGIKTSYVQLDPKAVSAVPSGSIYTDLTSSLVSIQSGGSGSSIQSTVNYFVKGATSGGVFANKAPLARDVVTGNVVAANADTNAADHIGWALTASTGANQSVSVFLIGPNLAGLVSGMGFTTGDEIFLDKNSGQMIKDISGLDPAAGIVLMGIADCADGVASAVATDLIVLRNAVSLP